MDQCQRFMDWSLCILRGVFGEQLDWIDMLGWSPMINLDGINNRLQLEVDEAFFFCLPTSCLIMWWLLNKCLPLATSTGIHMNGVAWWWAGHLLSHTRMKCMLLPGTWSSSEWSQPESQALRWSRSMRASGMKLLSRNVPQDQRNMKLHLCLVILCKCVWLFEDILNQKIYDPMHTNITEAYTLYILE